MMCPNNPPRMPVPMLEESGHETSPPPSLTRGWSPAERASSGAPLSRHFRFASGPTRPMYVLALASSDTANSSLRLPSLREVNLAVSQRSCPSFTILLCSAVDALFQKPLTWPFCEASSVCALGDILSKQFKTLDRGRSFRLHTHFLRVRYRCFRLSNLLVRFLHGRVARVILHRQLRPFDLSLPTVLVCNCCSSISAEFETCIVDDLAGVAFICFSSAAIRSFGRGDCLL